jgi:hypothetical protein
MSKNNVKYIQGINFSHWSLAEKTGIKNLGRATPDLVIFQSSLSRIQTYVRKCNPDVYAKHKQLSGCAEANALLCLPINHIIIHASALLRAAIGGRPHAQIQIYKTNIFPFNYNTDRLVDPFANWMTEQETRDWHHRPFDSTETHNWNGTHLDLPARK